MSAQAVAICLKSLMADTLQHAFSKVCNVFGFDSLNTHQEKSIKYIVQEKKDIFVNLPTGFGKSLIYRALPLAYSCLLSTCPFCVLWPPLPSNLPESSLSINIVDCSTNVV